MTTVCHKHAECSLFSECEVHTCGVFPSHLPAPGEEWAARGPQHCLQVPQGVLELAGVCEARTTCVHC